jgi:hypothetical protein
VIHGEKTGQGRLGWSEPDLDPGPAKYLRQVPNVSRETCSKAGAGEIPTSDVTDRHNVSRETLHTGDGGSRGMAHGLFTLTHRSRDGSVGTGDGHWVK